MPLAPAADVATELSLSPVSSPASTDGAATTPRRDLPPTRPVTPTGVSTLLRPSRARAIRSFGAADENATSEARRLLTNMFRAAAGGLQTDTGAGSDERLCASDFLRECFAQGLWQVEWCGAEGAQTAARSAIANAIRDVLRSPFGEGSPGWIFTLDNLLELDADTRAVQATPAQGRGRSASRGGGPRRRRGGSAGRGGAPGDFSGVVAAAAAAPGDDTYSWLFVPLVFAAGDAVHPHPWERRARETVADDALFNSAVAELRPVVAATPPRWQHHGGVQYIPADVQVSLIDDAIGWLVTRGVPPPFALQIIQQVAFEAVRESR